PGFEAPVNLAYSARNRSAAIRIPTYSPSPKAKRIEFRTPDAAANPYLAFSAMLLAGLDGIQNRMDPGDPLDKNLYELPPEELAQVASVPDSLDGAYEACGDVSKHLTRIMRQTTFAIRLVSLALAVSAPVLAQTSTDTTGKKALAVQTAESQASMTPASALEKLKKGNARFVEKN